MPLEIARQSLAAAAVESPVGAEAADVVKGQYRGQAVQVSSEASKLMQEAEEVGMAVASRADRRSLGQRDIRAGRGSSAEALARTKGQYEKLPDMPGEVELASLVDLLTSFQEGLASGGEGHPGPEDVLAALGRFDPDVTHQFAALDVARGHFEAEGADDAFLSLLDEARRSFDSPDVQRDVRAGYAIAEIASRAAATLETDPATVRDTYRAMLRETADMGRIFDKLRGFDPLKTLDQSIAVFTAAAGRDLAAAGPSADPAHLHALLTELGKLKKARTVLDAMARLISLTERGLPPALRGKADAAEQAGLVLAFASLGSAGAADAQRLLGAFRERRLQARLAFANGLRSLHGDIPDEVMPSPAARGQQVAALLGLLGDLVRAEEEEFAAGGAPR